MPFSDPEKISGESDFRRFTQEVLSDWLPRLQRGQVRVRVPKPHGLFRLVEQTHFHLRAELFVQLSGKTCFQFPEEKFEVGPGELCLVPRGVPHGERVRAWKGPFYNLVFESGHGTIGFHIARKWVQGRPGIFSASTLKSTPCISALLEEAAELAEEPRAALVAAYFSLVLAQMEGWSATAPSEPFKVTYARQIVNEQLSNPDLSVARVAHQLQCSSDYLSQVFRKATGLPLSAYINENRLIRSRDLLELTTLNIAEVSRAAGFADPAYFSRIFHRWQGVTPREYRRFHT